MMNTRNYITLSITISKWFSILNHVIFPTTLWEDIDLILCRRWRVIREFGTWSGSGKHSSKFIANMSVKSLKLQVTETDFGLTEKKKDEWMKEQWMNKWRLWGEFWANSQNWRAVFPVPGVCNAGPSHKKVSQLLPSLSGSVLFWIPRRVILSSVSRGQVRVGSQLCVCTMVGKKWAQEGCQGPWC